MSEIIISVIVPAYNVERFLVTCVDSILRQTFSAFELILIDDGATDNTGIICDDYLDKDTRVKVVHQTNQGLSAARNKGISLAKGEYITFIDSDDYIHSQFLEVLYDGLLKHDADISVCKYKTFLEDNYPNDQVINTDFKSLDNVTACEELIKKNKAYMIVAWGKLYKIELFKKIKYQVGKYHEDEFTTYKLLYTSNQVVVSNAQLYYYLQRENSIMSTKYNIKRLDKLEALLIAVNYFKDYNEIRLVSHAEYRYLLNLQIAAYRILFESDYADKYKDLQTTFKTYYSSIYDLNKLVMHRRLVLMIFNSIPLFTLKLIRLLDKTRKLFKR